MKMHYLKKLVVGLVVVLVGCDVVLLFAAQATAADNLSKEAASPPAAEAQQLQQLQAVQQTTGNQNMVQPKPNLLTNNQITSGPQTVTEAASPPPSNKMTQEPLPQSNNQNQAQGEQGVQGYYQSPVAEEAFNGVAQNALPMSPEQIQRLRQLFNSSQQAASAAGGVPPKPTASSQAVHLEPGATPPVIRLAQGFVTSLVFLDSSGAPWPIEAYDVGNPSVFNIQWNKLDNTLLLQPSSLYTYGNLAVRLKGLVTPVMLTLIPGQKAVDYRVDLRIQGLGPNAVSSPLGDALPPSANPELLNILDGIPPVGGKSVKVTGGSCQAWLLNNKMYVRTRLNILSPAWTATMSSADGMKAYEMQKTPMLLVSQDGQVIQLKVEGL